MTITKSLVLPLLGSTLLASACPGVFPPAPPVSAPATVGVPPINIINDNKSNSGSSSGADAMTESTNLPSTPATDAPRNNNPIPTPTQTPTPTATPYPIFDAAQDFSTTLQQGCWSYLAQSTKGDVTRLVPGAFGWIHPTESPKMIIISKKSNTHLMLHPSGDRVMLRWSAPSSRTYHVECDISDGDLGGGDGIEFRMISKNGLLRTENIGPLNSAPITFSLDVPVQMGNEIDFVVDQKTDYFYDATLLRVIIK
jgi:hypothetical protein